MILLEACSTFSSCLLYFFHLGSYIEKVPLQGPVVQSWISANPGLKFNLLF